MIGLDQEREFVRDADNGFDLQHRAGLREVSDNAGYAAGTIENERAGLEGAHTRRWSAVVLHASSFDDIICNFVK